MGERLEILITAEDAASGVFKGIQGAAGSLGNILGGLLTVGAAGATAAIGALGAGLALSFKEAMDAQEIIAQLNSVLQNTGEVTGVTSDMANQLADSLSKVTRFSDDAILSGETLLAGFNNIGKDVFPAASKAMLDLATRMKVDAASAAKVLGKMLNDPAGAAGLLERQGIKLDDALQQQIKSMVEAGDVAGAQKLILEQLNSTMGGAAEAAGQTLAGRMDILKNRLLNVAEGIGTKLLPIGERLLDQFIMPAVPVIEDLANALGYVFDAIADGEDIGGVFDALGESDTIQALARALGLSGNEFYALGASIQSTVDTIITTLQPAVDNLVSAFMEHMPEMIAAGQSFIEWLQGAFGIIGPQLLANFAAALNALADLWRAHGDEVIAALTITLQVIVATVGGALTLLSGIFTAALQAINGENQAAGQTLVDTWAAFMNMVLSIAGTNLQEFTATWQNNWNMLQTIVSTVTMQITAGFQNWIITTINGARAFAENLIGTLKGFYDTFVGVGQLWFDGITQGILMKVTQLTNAVVQSIMSVIAKARETLGIASPSQVFAEVGQQIMAGMAQGIAANVQVPAGALAGATPALAGAAAGAGAIGGGGETVIHNVITLDGQVLYESYNREKRARGD